MKMFLGVSLLLIAVWAEHGCL